MGDSTTPYAGLSDQRLTDLVNLDNTTTLRVGVDFTFGPPQPYSDGSGRNTQVTLYPKAGSIWSKPETIHYTRLSLQVLRELPSGWVNPVLITSAPFTLNDVLDSINTALGLNLTTDEIVNVQYDGVQPTYRLPINEEVSLGWIDSDYVFPAIFADIDIPLASAIQQTALSGLTYIQP